MPRRTNAPNWHQELLDYLAEVNDIIPELDSIVANGTLVGLPEEKLLVPFAKDLTNWLADYSSVQDGIAFEIKTDKLNYDMELPPWLDTRMDALWTQLVDFRTRIAALKKAAGVPEEAPETKPLPTGPEGEVPDDIAVLEDEVNRILQAAKGENPDPPLWAKAASVALPWLGVVDAITKKKWGTTAEQAATGAQVGVLSAITQMFGATTFSAFMLEEGCQAVGMSAWIAYNAKQYGTALDSLKEQDRLINEAFRVLELWRPLMPLTYPGFVRFFRASRTANDAWFLLVSDAATKAGRPPPPTLVVQSKPSGAQIYIDDEDTLTITPETFKYLSPGTHSVVAIIPATATKPEIGAAAEATLIAGKKLEIMLNLLPLEGAPPPEILPEAPATLRVSSTPSDGAIWLNDNDTGTLTPETFKELAAGPYKVLVIVPPRGSWPERRAAVTITLAPGEKRELSLSPTIP